MSHVKQYRLTLTVSYSNKVIKMNKIDAVKYLNRLRKENKNAWVFWNGIVAGREVSYKAYKTWVQYLTIDGLKYSNECDCTVAAFVTFLNETL